MSARRVGAVFLATIVSGAAGEPPAGDVAPERNRSRPARRPDDSHALPAGAHTAIVRLNAEGEIAAFAGQASGTVHLIFDVNGYVQP